MAIFYFSLTKYRLNYHLKNKAIASSRGNADCPGVRRRR